MTHDVIDFSKALAKRKLSKAPWEARHYYNLALSLRNDEVIKLSINHQRQIFTKKTLLMRAIELDQTCPYAYNNLANQLNVNESVYLVMDGRVFCCNQFILYQLALACDPNYAPAYCNLAVYLQKTGQHHLTLSLNGRSVKYSVKELYLEAIYLNPKLSIAYNNLALLLSETGSFVRMRIAGFMKTFTEGDLFKKAIEVDPENAEAYYNLSTLLPDDQKIVSIQLKGQWVNFNRQQLLIKALKINPRHANAYYNLAVITGRQGLSQINVNGQLYSEADLYIKTIESDRNHFLAYYNLAYLTPVGQQVVLNIDGQKVQVDKQSLYLQVIRIKPDFVDAYYNLALTLPTGDSAVHVPVAARQHKLTQLELFELVLGLDDQHNLARDALASISSKEGL